MPLQTISATDLRTRTREIMQRVKFKHETFLVENFKESMAVIVNVEEYEQLLERSKHKAETEMTRQNTNLVSEER